MRVVDLTQEEVGEAKQDIVSPVREIQQKTLQGILGNEAKLVIHVDSQTVGNKDYFFQSEGKLAWNQKSRFHTLKNSDLTNSKQVVKLNLVTYIILKKLLLFSTY